MILYTITIILSIQKSAIIQLISIVIIPYLNLPIIKWKIQEFKIIKEIKKIIAKNKDEDIRIIAYSPYLPFLNAIKKIKKNYPFIKSNMIVTDCVPGRGDM